MRPFKREIREKKGIALIMALWIMTILLVVAASFAFMMRTEVRMAGNYRNGVKAHYLALAGVEHAIAALLNDANDVDHLDEAWFTTFSQKIIAAQGWHDTSQADCPKNFEPISFNFGSGTYAVDISDESSKYNLNYPNSSGLQYLVAIDNDASTLIPQGKICGIKDYVDSDSDVTQWAVGTDRGYEPQKNKPFDTVYEIQKVRGYEASAAYGGIVKINDGPPASSKIYDNPLDTLLDASGNKRRGDQSDMTVYSQDYNTQVGGSARSVDVNDPSVTKTDYTGIGFRDAEATEIMKEPPFSKYPYPWVGDDLSEDQGVGAPGWATVGLQDGTGIAGFPGVSPVEAVLDSDWVSPASMILAADKMTCGTYSIYGSENIIEGAVNINTATLYGIQTLFNIGLVNGADIIATRQDDKDCKGPDGVYGTILKNTDNGLLSTIPLPPDYTPESSGGSPRGTSKRYFANRGEIMMVWGIGKGIFQDCGDLITVRTDRFRIYSIGKVGIDGNSDGDLEDSEDTVFAARKIEAVIDRGYHADQFMGPITVLYWSERVFED